MCCVTQSKETHFSEPHFPPLEHEGNKCTLYRGGVHIKQDNTYNTYICIIPEKEMAPHSSTLAWKIHGQRSLVGCSPWGR